MTSQCMTCHQYYQLGHSHSCYGGGVGGGGNLLQQYPYNNWVWEVIEIRGRYAYLLNKMTGQVYRKRIIVEGNK